MIYTTSECEHRHRELVPAIACAGRRLRARGRPAGRSINVWSGEGLDRVRVCHVLRGAGAKPIAHFADDRPQEPQEGDWLTKVYEACRREAELTPMRISWIGRTGRRFETGDDGLEPRCKNHTPDAELEGTIVD